MKNLECSVFQSITSDLSYCVSTNLNMDKKVTEGETYLSSENIRSSEGPEEQFKSTPVFNEAYEQLQKVHSSLKMEAESLQRERAHFEVISKKLDGVHFSPIIRLNVGGQIYQTTRETLMKDSGCLFPLMFSGKFDLNKDDTDAYFIDRDGTHFRHILNFLRIGGLPSRKIIDDIREELLIEADFYQLNGLIELLDPTFEIDESVVLTENTPTAPFKKWLPFDQRKWFRMYCGSKDGWGADTFHKLCDQAELTLTVIKCTQGHIFGGYTDQSWVGKSLRCYNRRISITGSW